MWHIIWNTIRLVAIHISHSYMVSYFAKKFLYKPVLAIKPPPTYIEIQEQLFATEIEACNSNIPPIFYNKAEFAEFIEDKNDLEREWKTRVIFENTPRGNIIMHYDIYKGGFAYYSDMQGIPYAVLNAAAMKYARIFRCRDFFIHTEKKPIKIEMKLPKTAAFAKLKNYTVTVEPETVQNKFIFLGKIANYNLLQPAPKPVPKMDVHFQKDKISYNFYKSLFGN